VVFHMALETMAILFYSFECLRSCISSVSFDTCAVAGNVVGVLRIGGMFREV